MKWISQVQMMLHQLDHSGNELINQLAQISQNAVHSEVEHLVQDTQHRVGEELHHKIDTALQHVVDVLDEVHGTMHGDGEHTSMLRGMLEKPIHEAEHTVELLKKGIEDVKHFAAKFGVRLNI